MTTTHENPTTVAAEWFGQEVEKWNAEFSQGTFPDWEGLIRAPFACFSGIKGARIAMGRLGYTATVFDLENGVLFMASFSGITIVMYRASFPGDRYDEEGLKKFLFEIQGLTRLEEALSLDPVNTFENMRLSPGEIKVVLRRLLVEGINPLDYLVLNPLV